MAATRTPSFDGLFSLRALFSILFGLAVLFVLLVPQVNLILLFGAYALLDGTLAVVSSFQVDDQAFRRSLLLIEGTWGLAAAALVLALYPFWSIALTWLIAVWAMLTGVLNLSASLRARLQETRPWVSMWAGIIRSGYGVLTWFLPSNFPEVGTMAGRFAVFVVLTGAMSILFGVTVLAKGSASSPGSRLPMDQPHSP